MNFRTFLILIHDDHFTILNILAVWKCLFSSSHMNSIILIPTQQNRDFFSEIVHSARSMSVSIWFNHWICFKIFLRISNAICSWLIAMFFDFLISMSYKKGLICFEIWSVKIRIIILMNCVIEFMVFWEKIVIRISFIGVWNFVKFRKICIKKNWSWSENIFITKKSSCCLRIVSKNHS